MNKISTMKTTFIHKMLKYSLTFPAAMFSTWTFRPDSLLVFWPKTNAIYVKKNNYWGNYLINNDSEMLELT